MKDLFRSIVAKILEWQVCRLQKKNRFKTIAVVGSIGKTSTKLAAAEALKRVGKTQFQEGNYNDRVTVPLIFFGLENPKKVTDVIAWLKVFINAEKQLWSKYPYKYVVIELGTDGPGQIQQFSYLNVDLAIITAITPEHMEQFKTIEAVAHEELSVAEFSKHLLINQDLCDKKWLKRLGKSYIAYGKNKKADIRIASGKSDGAFSINMGNKTIFSAKQADISDAKKYTLAAMLGVLSYVGINSQDTLHPIIMSILEVQVPGRMQRLPGIKNSTIIDDTYNSSPEAVKMALNVLYESSAEQKIAILGSMNEMGAVSEEVHREVGTLCKAKEIDLLVTIGKEANSWLAEEAENNGCTVKRFTNPFEAGVFIQENIKNNALVLAKGSQNGVFAEEALKPILKNAHDERKLVRQSPVWLEKKRNQFGAGPR